jgi:hypothetical protein
MRYNIKCNSLPRAMHLHAEAPGYFLSAFPFMLFVFWSGLLLALRWTEVDS